MNVFRDHIAAVEQASRHILAVARVALHHLVIRLEARHRDLLDRIGLMRSFSGRYNRRVGHKGEMDTWIWYQVGLEFVQVNIQRAVKTKGSSDGRDDCYRCQRYLLGSMNVSRTLGNQAIQILVVWPLNAEVATADVVNGLIIDHERAVGVLKRGVGSQD